MKTQSDKKSTDSINVGDLVIQDEFGEGIVVERRNSSTFLVRFDNGFKALVSKNELKKVEMQVVDDGSEEETDDTSFSVIPSNYSEQDCYSKNAKLLLNFLRKKYKDGGMASIKSYPDGNGEIGVLVVPNKGIVVFKMINNWTESDADLLKSQIAIKTLNKQYEDFRNYYLNKFYLSKVFCFCGEQFKILKYPIRFVFLLENIDLSKISKTELSQIDLKNKNILFKRFSSILDGNDLLSNFEKFEDMNAPMVGPSCYGAVLERVIPENATLVDIASSAKPSKEPPPRYNSGFKPITGKEREFDALGLDDSQIKAINDTKTGHYLTLANPGTGKSVLLVSKAYRIQSTNPGNVLITCFNNNLAEHHNTFAQISGMKTNKLRIATFHGFIKEMLSEKDRDEVLAIEAQTEDIGQRFERMFSSLTKKLDAGKLRTFNFDAIFIDEVQLFRPEWIDFCYRLLSQQKGKEFFFEMFGDINQDVKELKPKGKAPWQLTRYVPSLRGRTKYLKVNYRNNKIIASFLNLAITNLNNFLQSKGVPVDEELACLTSNATREGKLNPKKFYSKKGSFLRVVKIIQDLVDNPITKAEYTDIAIIYPAKQYLDYYTPIVAIENELNQANIPFCYICGDMLTKKKIFDCDGVIFTTIDSSMGLDFKYVILCGLHYWDLVHIDGKKKPAELHEFYKTNEYAALRRIGEIGKCFYTGCSRAREGLFIIDDLDIASPLRDIVWPVPKKD